MQIRNDGGLLRCRLGGRSNSLLPGFDFNDRRLRWRWRKRFDQLPSRAFRMRVDVVDDVLDVFRHRRGFEIEKLRTRNGNMRDGLVDLEK